MRIKCMPREDTTTIELGANDGAFVFRPQTGIEVYIPPNPSDDVTSAETTTAMMLAWIITTPAVREEMLQRLQVALDASKDK